MIIEDTYSRRVHTKQEFIEILCYIIESLEKSNLETLKQETLKLEKSKPNIGTVRLFLPMVDGHGKPKFQKSIKITKISRNGLLRNTS